MKPEEITPHEVDSMMAHIGQHGEAAEFNGDTMRAVLQALRLDRAALSSTQSQLAQVTAERDAAREELKREEESHAGTIAQRDAAEACIEKILGVLGIENGRDYEWSNAFGFADAVELAQERGAAREELERVRDEVDTAFLDGHAIGCLDGVDAHYGDRIKPATFRLQEWRERRAALQADTTKMEGGVSNFPSPVKKALGANLFGIPELPESIPASAAFAPGGQFPPHEGRRFPLG